MTRDDIIRMAREAGMVKMTSPSGAELGDWWGVDMPDIERFAALVSAAEREQCAAIAKDWDKDHPNTNYGGCIAIAIRSRSES
jgi:hypothetical protein